MKIRRELGSQFVYEPGGNVRHDDLRFSFDLLRMINGDEVERKYGWGDASSFKKAPVQICLLPS